MNENGGSIYRIVDGMPNTALVRRIEARKRVERKAHALVAQTTDGRGRVPMVVRELFPDWWYDLRRKQNTIYGGLLRFIDMSILARVPKAMLKMIPAWITEYIENGYDDAAAAECQSTAA